VNPRGFRGVPGIPPDPTIPPVFRWIPGSRGSPWSPAFRAHSPGFQGGILGSPAFGAGVWTRPQNSPPPLLAGGPQNSPPPPLAATGAGKSNPGFLRNPLSARPGPARRPAKSNPGFFFQPPSARPAPCETPLKRLRNGFSPRGRPIPSHQDK
jgi:hypothetical protein